MNNIRNTQSSAGQVSLISMALTLILAASKLAAGLISSSSALISDGIHSGFDLICDGAVVLGIFLSSRPADTKYPYGRGKFEYIMSLTLAVMLAMAGFYIASNGLTLLINGSAQASERPLPAIIAASAAILIKAFLWRLTHHTAARTGSIALESCSRHHFADLSATLFALAGIIGGTLGCPAADPAASIAVAVFMLKAAADIFREALVGLSDRACDDETIDAVYALISKYARPLRLICCHRDSRIEVNAELMTEADIPLREICSLRSEIVSRLRSDFGGSTVCHIEFCLDDKTDTV